MALDGVHLDRVTIAANSLKAASDHAGASSGVNFSSLLFDALSPESVAGSASFGSPYQYIGALVQKTDSPGAVMAALISAGFSDFSQFALFGAWSALLGGDVQAEMSGFSAANALPRTLTAPPHIPVCPAITSDASQRSAQAYADVINQFRVETNPRYAVNQKGRGDTYCNIFVWDVTSAMNAEIPHYYNAETGAPMKRGEQDARAMNANAMFDWLKEFGEEYGWREVTAEEAQHLANAGHPVVTALKRPGAHGHVQIVCPSKDGTFNPQKGVTVAQAGSNLTRYSHITDILGSSSLSKVSYFAHM
ncbi:MAG: hypothetical protein ACOYIR_05015 [Christensenellales bacterium]|jgi:hypothetical protein